jgi:hypothetical protein
LGYFLIVNFIPALDPVRPEFPIRDPGCEALSCRYLHRLAGFDIKIPTQRNHAYNNRQQPPNNQLPNQFSNHLFSPWSRFDLPQYMAFANYVSHRKSEYSPLIARMFFLVNQNK